MIEVREGVWRAVWSGGRLADIYHAESDTPLDCKQVGEYSFAWNRDELERRRADLGENDVRAALIEWIDESGEDYSRELPYLI
jgi:hypothetical protein